MFPNFEICSEIWKDIKFLKKKTKNKIFNPDLNNFKDLSDKNKLISIPILRTIITYISQTSESANDTSDLYARQPFLNLGWKIYKLRYAFDKKGKNKGFRIIFCKKKDRFLLVYINLKSYCVNERKLEKIFAKRIKDYLTFQV